MNLTPLLARLCALAAHVPAALLMVAAAPVMMVAIQRDSTAFLGARLGALHFANLLECLIP